MIIPNASKLPAIDFSSVSEANRLIAELCEKLSQLDGGQVVYILHDVQTPTGREFTIKATPVSSIQE